MSLRPIYIFKWNSNINSIFAKYERLKTLSLFCNSSCSDNSKSSDPEKIETSPSVGQTSILVQHGSDIQELPVVLRKIKTDEFVTIWSEPNNTEMIDGNNQTLNKVNQIEVKSEEAIKLLNNCVTSAGILSIINEIPESALNPDIASHAFDKLIRNDTVIGLRNLEESSPVFEKLIRCILKSGDHKLLLDIMEMLKTFLDLQKTVQRFCDELLLRNSDGALSIVETCECIDRFIDCQQHFAAEKFWTGISDAEKSINEQNIKFIYKVLPKLKISRRLLLGILEKRIGNFWYLLTPEAVTESIEALAKMNSTCTALRTMQFFARWLNTNIHVVNGKHLEVIVKSYTKLDFSNSEIEKALSRYVKAKGIKITSESLTIAILEHCLHFRLRNHIILNGFSEVFICNWNRFSPDVLKTLIQTFGFLHYQPLNGIKFWQIIEEYIKENFHKFNPIHLIEIFLNCCYLEMYPLNFVKSVFNPHFIDSIHSSIDPERLLKIRSDLKLLDVALTIEVETYSGPFLPKDNLSKSIWQDGRIKRIVNQTMDYFEKIAGSSDNLTRGVIIGKLPVNSLYIVDVLVHPPGFKTFSFNIKDDYNVLVAVLIMIPEYYDSKGEFLIGPQHMRIRHLRKMGIKVATLNYDRLAKLRMHPVQLHKYLVERMKETYSALPTKEI
ncbi:FAST kinase domain-containing protein 3, mitochondrial-like [Condylostylus longicornis]|uniref:FAST kinase domain-containing protein 3, mitochondrial-like n=1 Tax=Condylostylus longicornis TaxID=2530218 RepID=UPI00244E34D1|nr:FAST kinase domain-containing protein 3, mitochondrial-like [Condylostylus longicornis]